MEVASSPSSTGHEACFPLLLVLWSKFGSCCHPILNAVPAYIYKDATRWKFCIHAVQTPGSYWNLVCGPEFVRRPLVSSNPRRKCSLTSSSSFPDVFKKGVEIGVKNNFPRVRVKHEHAHWTRPETRGDEWKEIVAEESHSCTCITFYMQKMCIICQFRFSDCPRHCSSGLQIKRIFLPCEAQFTSLEFRRSAYKMKAADSGGWGATSMTMEIHFIRLPPHDGLTTRPSVELSYY